MSDNSLYRDISQSDSFASANTREQEFNNASFYKEEGSEDKNGLSDVHELHPVPVKEITGTHSVKLPQHLAHHDKHANRRKRRFFILLIIAILLGLSICSVVCVFKKPQQPVKIAPVQEVSHKIESALVPVSAPKPVVVPEEKPKPP